ncbi:Queuosine Biosynthesis QueC ATPase [Chitinispirillum alkaliphilum]|nr:Queuosine Biosynthesis QueC ATPase [Chitinispirillum alkaliphilum]
MSNKKAVILLSGGIDSATCAAIAKDEGYQLYGMSFSYGQRHAVELEAAKRTGKFFSIHEHRIISLDPAAFSSNALTDDIEVPKNGNDKDSIPVTYVPARNTIFLSLALGWAEVLEVNDIFIGVNAVDYSGYPDCRPEFISSFEAMANLATKAAVNGRKIHIRTPLMNLSKAQIIQTGTKLGFDYSLTHSCYDPSSDGAACGECDSCLIRKAGFKKAGVKDPTRYITLNAV